MNDIAPKLTPPVAAVRAEAVDSPHGARLDLYYWLRDDTRLDTRVLGYLADENAYADAMLAPVKKLREDLYGEIVGRIRQDDSTVPYLERGYYYYTRFETGAEYPIHARRRQVAGAALDAAPEEILLDGNELARGHEFHQIGAFEVSPDNALIAYAEDTVGRRQYVIRVRNLSTGELHPDLIENAEPGVVWADDNRSIVYIEKDPTTLLGLRVKRHRLGTEAASDELLWEQDDESFYTDVVRSKSNRYIFIATESTVASEWWYARADDPALRFERVLARERDHEYQVEHLGDTFVIRTNWQAPNFRIMQAPLGSAHDRSTWREVVPHRADVFVHDFEVFRDHLVVAERSGGLRRIRVRPWTMGAAGGEETIIAADEPAYTALLGTNVDIDTHLLRYTYTSLTTPTSTYDYDMRSGARTLLKRDPVLGDFDPANYVTEYVHAIAPDGARVPVSLVYRQGTPRNGTAPLYQYAYGSYGLSSDPTFSSSRLSLLDRGFVYAIAHVRGGQELGRQWYDHGRLLHKKNSFTDFIAATDFLVAQGYAARDKVFAHGRSAGGLLVGAIANMAPDRFRAILADVPFVDVVTTMLDESIPLTTGEFDEWGNPQVAEYYDYMLSYSPYDQVKAQQYPAMLITTGLWDSQVQYFEPAKWVAKLRAHKTDDHPLLFRTYMEAGHGGKSGRFQSYQDTAMRYAFMLDMAGIGR